MNHQSGFRRGLGKIHAPQPIRLRFTFLSFLLEQSYFEGGGHSISNLYISGSDSDVGLFGRTWSDSHIRNLRLLSVTVTGHTRVGGLVGDNVGGTITASSVTGLVIGYNSVGGLVGDNDGGTIADSYSTAAVTGSGGLIGGLVGYVDTNTTIKSSYATGNVNSGGGDAGGLAGRISSGGTITASYASGDVTGNGDGDTGGLAGSNYGSGITASYASGNVVNRYEYYGRRTGGLIGYNTGIVISGYAAGAVTGHGQVGGLIGENHSTLVTATYSTGSVTLLPLESNSEDANAGGLIGSGSGSVNASYWDTQTSGQTDSPGGGNPKTTQRVAVAYWSLRNLRDLELGPVGLRYIQPVPGAEVRCPQRDRPALESGPGPGNCQGQD